MLYLSSVLSVALAAQAVLATPVKSRTAYKLKEVHRVPRSWKSQGRASSDHMIHMQIGLKQDKFDELERHLYEVSDPEHSRYGQYLDVEDIHDLVAPSEESLDLVHEWLLTNGVDKINYSPAKDWINIYIDVASAERLLDTKYSVYEHEDGTQLIRTPDWSLPKHLHDVIDTIQPTNSFMRTKPKSTDWIQFEDGNDWTPPGYEPPTNETIAKVCNVKSVTLECFKTLYGTLDYIQKVPELNSVAFNNYLNETPIRPDLLEFLTLYNPIAAPTAEIFESIEIAGGPAALYTPLTPAEASTGVGQEANLDAGTIIGMTFPIPVTSFSTGGEPPFIPDAGNPTDTNEPYLTWTTYISGLKKIPYVISSSYGDTEETVPYSYAKRVCKEFAQIGARGTTLFVSSGDGGLGGPTAADCINNQNKTAFVPAFPASCPFVTSVGAVQEFEPQVAAFREPGLGLDGKNHTSYYASGSGFSNYFPRPAYQNPAVGDYVKALNGEYKGLYNPNGRAFPDVSAQGLYFAYVWNGTLSDISGTSASCPLMSSVAAIVNDALLASGKPTLGFLNPRLYGGLYKGFTDITGGNTTSCGTDGFPVTKGWDPVTGWGTPDFPAIVGLLGCEK